jgi:hypothetical protein
MHKISFSKKTEKTSSNFNPVNNVNVKVNTQSREINTQEVDYGDDVQVIYTDYELTALQEENRKIVNQIEALKICIQIIQDNPLYINSLILADDETLQRLIKLLTDAEVVTIETEDAEGCIPKKYRKITSIYINVDGQVKNLKYDFPSVMQELKDLRINLKYVW